MKEVGDESTLDLEGKTEEELRAIDRQQEHRLEELELENEQLRQAIYRLKRQLKTISRM